MYPTEDIAGQYDTLFSFSLVILHPISQINASNFFVKISNAVTIIVCSLIAACCTLHLRFYVACYSNYMPAYGVTLVSSDQGTKRAENT